MSWYRLGFQQQLCDMDYVFLSEVKWKYRFLRQDYRNMIPATVRWNDNTISTTAMWYEIYKQPILTTVIQFQQQWGEMKYKNISWCDINQMPLRWASRWADSEKNTQTSGWSEMKYSNHFSRCCEMKYDLSKWLYFASCSIMML